MGTCNSKAIELFLNNEHFKEFISQTKFEVKNPLWKNWLTLNHRYLSKDDDKFLFQQTEVHFNEFVVNNLATGNLISLNTMFIRCTKKVLVSPCKYLERFLPRMVNAILITRFFLQHLVHKCHENDIIRHFNGQVEVIDTLPSESVGSSGSPDDISTLHSENTNFKEEESQLNASPDALSDYLECLYSILINFPIQNDTYALHFECMNILLVFLSVELFTTETISEMKMTKFIFEAKDSKKLASCLTMRFISLSSKEEEHSILAGLFRLLTFSSTPSENEEALLSNNAILLLNVLVNQYTGYPNPIRESLSSLPAEFNTLYKTLCLSLEKEETTLLIYHLLQQNERFKKYVVTSDDIQILVVPMLQAIYNAKDSSCHHMYMALIILLILTEEVEFNKKVHDIVVKCPIWYKDKNIGDLTLGGLIILVTTRTVKRNLLKIRDEYLHTNCLAALANMSSQFVNLHPHVCQRLVGLYEVLAKTYNRAGQEMDAVEKALRIILEVLNSCLTNKLVYNSNLLYTLLHKKEIFDTFLDNPAFQDIINNIKQVLQHFVEILDSEEESWSDVESVLNIIKTSLPTWTSHMIHKFPELKFKYVEEERPEVFFIPYVWSLVTDTTKLYFESSLFKK